MWPAESGSQPPGAPPTSPRRAASGRSRWVSARAVLAIDPRELVRHRVRGAALVEGHELLLQLPAVAGPKSQDCCRRGQRNLLQARAREGRRAVVARAERPRQRGRVEVAGPWWRERRGRDSAAAEGRGPRRRELREVAAAQEGEADGTSSQRGRTVRGRGAKRVCAVHHCVGADKYGRTDGERIRLYQKRR
ncbi:unnamed protein product [Urochloa humidicola]